MSSSLKIWYVLKKANLKMLLSFHEIHTGSSCSNEKVFTISLDPAVAESSSCCNESLPSANKHQSMYPTLTTDWLNKKHRHFLIDMQVT